MISRNSKRKTAQFSMITCYDFAFARLAEQAEIDSILIGIRWAMWWPATATTIPVTLESR